MTGEAKGPPPSTPAPRAAGRVLSDAEVSQILEKAADLQERSVHRRARSGHDLTVEDLREIAREAGIDPQFVDIAVEQGRGSLAPRRSPLLGAAHTWRFHSEVPGTLRPEDRSRLVQAVRSLLEEQGEATELYGRTEWRYDDTMGPLTVSVYPTDRSVEIDVSGNRKAEAGTLVGAGTFFGGWFGTLFLGWSGLLNLDAAPFLILPGLAAVSVIASFGLSRTIWRMRSEWWARRLRQISDSLSMTVQDMALPGPDPEQDRAAAPDLLEGPADRGSSGP